jgi:hypothetical protein
MTSLHPFQHAPAFGCRLSAFQLFGFALCRMRDSQ